MDDMALLREYATRNSEDAFAELVSRRLNFVYSAALRQVRDPQLAEEVTQAVFVILAQKAGKISGKTILTGWLFRTTRFAALAQMRAAAKRRQREQEAQMQTELQSAAPNLLWEQLSPLLDEALASLGEKDRQAVLLRFFENQSLAQIGSTLGMGEDTARKRVSRAMEKLHRYFSKCGVSSTAAVLAGVIPTHAVQAAPVALAKSVTAVVLTQGAAAGGSTLTLIQGALKLMAWTKAKTAAVVGVGVLLAAGTTTVIVEKVSQTRPGEAQLAAARDYYEKAMRHYYAKEYEEELADLDKAIELNPNYPEALFSRACLYDFELPKRDSLKAIADYTRMLEINPRDCSGRHNRALCYAQLREYDKAIADYTRIIEGDTDFSRIGDGKDKQLARDYHYRGRVYFAEKNYVNAVADFNEALRLDPEVAKPEAGGRIILWRGQAYHALKEYAKAQEDFAHYAEIDPTYSELWQSWAWQLATCPDARFRDGRKALEYAGRVKNDETLAAAYAELGQFGEAVRWQKRALNSSVSAAKAKRTAMEARLKLYEARRPFREE